MLHGFDLSHHQSDKVFNQCLDINPDFIILKATEGRTWKDATFMERARKVLDKGILLGAYHFARPENGNSPLEEFTNFHNMIKELSIAPRPFLDIEAEALKFPDWCEKWMEKAKLVYKNVGYYCSKAEVDTRMKELRGKYPLWVAHYNNDDMNGCTHIEGEIITQYVSVPVDTNVAIDMTPAEWYGTDAGNEIAMALTEREVKVINMLRSLY